MVQNQTPNAMEATNVWSGIWSVEENHNEDASWLGKMKRRMRRGEKQIEVEISIQDVVDDIRKMINWKASGPDSVRHFWFKRFKSLHGLIAECPGLLG